MLFFNDIAVTEIGGHHYALVDDVNSTVHVINVTEPGSPKYVSNATNGTSGFVLAGTSRIIATEINGGHYALVTSFNDHSMQVIDVTDPANPKAAGLARHGEDGFMELRNSIGIATAEIEGRHYALVTSTNGDALQIIDITNPTACRLLPPLPIRLIIPGGVDVMQIGGHHYALVSNTIGDGGSHIYVINVTDPSDPSIESIIDGTRTSNIGGVLEPPSMPPCR